ncbi:hypothetical protein PSQ19_05005 [Devosia algicola]|uniref:Hydrolase n=1 Tax=Devosia algicola TaxID=3026418 RepID=A0ABY7YSS9_9HYPH|nr:HAD family hydrolase [Devosia algicola]WDR04400.1 hypothetical protein PSQ19_05005 [Devosia algicola]
MAPIKLIIFDCDGVLVDSEPLAMRVLLQVIAAQGTEIDPSQAYKNFLGRSLSSISHSLNQSHGTGLSDEALADIRTELYEPFSSRIEANFMAKTCTERAGPPHLRRLVQHIGTHPPKP